MAGIRGDARLFSLHKACRQHDLLSDELTAAALRCPGDVACTAIEFVPVLEYIKASAFAAARNQAVALGERLKLQLVNACTLLDFLGLHASTLPPVEQKLTEW